MGSIDPAINLAAKRLKMVINTTKMLVFNQIVRFSFANKKIKPGIPSENKMRSGRMSQANPKTKPVTIQLPRPCRILSNKSKE